MSLEEWRKRERQQAALDLREVLKTGAGKRFMVRLLLRSGVYAAVASKRDVARRELGLQLERDVLRACGLKAWQELQRIRLTEMAPPSTEVVPPLADASDS